MKWREFLISGIDEYAKLMIVDFGDWMHVNAIQSNIATKNSDDKLLWYLKGIAGRFTTKEIFDIYLKQLNESNTKGGD